ncbi:MAG: hypothetical protein GY809_06195, partial [Planctomycetes bacterium]|nr:hypothetical protein [Planctomycetota bacterium]
GGRDELAYTCTDASGVDSFVYEIIDPNGQTQDGFVMIYITPRTYAPPVWGMDELVNGHFDDETVGSHGWVVDVQSWPGFGHLTINPSVWGTDPDAHSGTGAVTLNSNGSWIWQNLKDLNGANILIAPNQTYIVTLWAGRITGQSEVAPALRVGIHECLSTWAWLDSETDVLSDLTPGDDMVKRTYTLTTGAEPNDVGAPLALNIGNIADSTPYATYQGRVMLDDVSVILAEPKAT